MTARLSDEDRREIWKAFKEAVNMTPKELESWLDTEESRSAGWTREGETEAVGHKSGRRIAEIEHKKKADLSDEDYLHMRKVVGYVRRHTAQAPGGNREHSRWRYSLMNWGHDPMKDEGTARS